MKPVFRFAAALVALCLLFSCGCSREIPDAYSLLCDLLLRSGEDTDGSGYIYSKTAEEGSEGYLTDERLILLYGEKYEKLSPLVEDCALYISARGVGELAIFKCFSRSDTDALLPLLLERADLLKVGLRGTPFEEKSRAISIRISGKYLLFCFVETPKHVEKRFFELI